MKYLFSLILFTSLISCMKDDGNNNLGQTEQDIIQYIDTHNLAATRTSNGAYYVIDVQGSGDKPTSDAYLKVNYKGYFLDGVQFDSNDAESATLDLLNVIPGLKQGLLNFNKGTKGTILIPPNLAYGDAGVKNVIPGGAVLIFDIEVLKVINPQSEIDIDAYLVENNLEAQISDSGLYYIIDEPGTGDPITETSIVTVAYKGYSLDGIVFDSSQDGVQFNLKNVIPGFAEGLTYFKVGGKGTLLMPPNLAYGSEGNGSIPRNAVLIFDIEVKSLNN